MHFFAVFLLLLTSLSAQNSDAYQGWVNQGMQALRNARYPEAVTAFQKATDLNPNEVPPRLYLAVAYHQQFIPGVETPENQQFAQSAEVAFQKVLDLAPQNVGALASLASLSLNRKKWEDAANWYRRVLAVEPGSREAYYSLGFIAWSKWYPAYMEARARLGMRPEMPGPIADSATRAGLRAQWWSVLDDGIWNLNRAMEIDPHYDDAMAYMNLLIRERADLRDNAAEYQQDILTADDWVRKVLETKRLRPMRGRPGGAGITFSPQPGSVPGIVGGIVSAPPPPPPPPPAQSGTPSPAPAPGIRVGATVQQTRLIKKVSPVYPPLAVQARIEGTVRFQVVIDKDGAIKSLQLISGHPLLTPAAIEAVRQWVYQPTLLNGEPIDVISQIDVPFTLPN